jgi:four helix bundle protein
MEHPKSSPQVNTAKPYDIRERSFLFACDVIRAAQELHQRGRIAGALSLHLVECVVNAASNLEEGNDGSSPRDFRAKDRIALREFKESRLRLRILRATGYLTEQHDPLIRESTELVKIIATMIRNSAANELRRG